MRRRVDVVPHVQHRVSLVDDPALRAATTTTASPARRTSRRRRLAVPVQPRRQIRRPVTPVLLLLLLLLPQLKDNLLVLLLLGRLLLVYRDNGVARLEGRRLLVLAERLEELADLVAGGVGRRRHGVVLGRDARVGAALEARRDAEGTG